MTTQLPARFGKYELLEHFPGGMSDVYRAKETVIGKTVAIKVLKQEACADPEQKARFLEEARIAANLEHENIINVFDFGEDQGRPFMVMEFIRGESLRSAIQQHHTGDLSNKLRIALQIAKALEHIHKSGVLAHRDLKPENIHITSSGTAKLMDFGIAKAENSMLKTQEGFSLGTVYYMAPEQVLGKPPTNLMDVYAFGILLFELMTGARPITGDSVERIFYRILNERLNLEPLREAGIPESVVDLIRRCTAKLPAERPQNFAIICEQLQSMLPRAARLLPQDQPVARRTIPRWCFYVAAVAVLGAVAWYFWPRPKSQSSTKKIENGSTAIRMISDFLPNPSGDMVLVREGEFLFGQHKEKKTLPNFYIDRTEVTNKAYAEFCKSKGLPGPKGKSEYPVVNVTVADAREFCAWAGKRLPTALEWEKAARGTDGREYPWGSEADTSRANVKDNRRLRKHALMPADSLNEGASPYGALHMAGNVWEYVKDSRSPNAEELRNFQKNGGLSPPATADEEWVLIYGGDYSLPLSKLWDSALVPARFSHENIGFRCAKNP